MDSSHIATGTITALLATVLVYLSHWPLQPLDLPTHRPLPGCSSPLAAGPSSFTNRGPNPLCRPLL